jgi:hypothetical protein
MLLLKKKVIMLIMVGAMLFAFVLPLGAQAVVSWPDVGVMGTTSLGPILQTYVYEETIDALTNVVKQRALSMFRDNVYKLVGEGGTLVGNWGKYLFSASDNAAAKYWNSFLANCTNIDTSISLKIKNTAIDRKQSYNWCPVKVNARGVNLGEVDVSSPHGWSDYADKIAYNNPTAIYYRALENIDNVRAQTETTQQMSALGSGLSSVPKGDINDTSPELTSEGGPQLPAESDNMDLDTYMQQYFDVLAAASQGTVMVQANAKGFLSSIISYQLNRYLDKALGTSTFGDY